MESASPKGEGHNKTVIVCKYSMNNTAETNYTQLNNATDKNNKENKYVSDCACVQYT